MPIVKDKYGNDRNTDLIFGVEARITHPTRNDYKGCWFMWKKYKTQLAMLQGLKDCRKTANTTGSMSEDSGKTWHRSVWEFRPVHVNYDFEKESTTEFKPMETNKIIPAERITLNKLVNRAICYLLQHNPVHDSEIKLGDFSSCEAHCSRCGESLFGTTGIGDGRWVYINWKP